MEQITRQIEWNVTLWMQLFLYLGSFLAFVIAAWRLHRRTRVWRLGRPADASFSFIGSLINATRWMLNQGKMPRDAFAFWMHFLVLWGFIILFIGTTLVFLEHQISLHFFYGTFYLVASSVLDLGGVAFLLGLSMAAFRRYVRHAKRLKASTWIDALLGLMMAIGMTGFLLEGSRISVTLPSFERISFVGYSFALIFRAAGLNAEELTRLHRIMWIVHAGLSITFFGLATTYFFRHIFVSLLSVALRPTRPRGALRPYGLPQDSIPVGTVFDVTWKDLLDADACTTCGRCTAVCPATTAGKALDPRAVVLKFSDLVDRHASRNDRLNPSVFNTIADQELWDCTTCGACVAECPVDIEVFDKIIDLRRQLVDIGRISSAARSCLEGLDERQNPWGHAPAQRLAWSETLKLPAATPGKGQEWVYWIGCAGAFEPTAQSISRAMVEILRQARVDFVVLGNEERCTGDPARRLGDEMLFQRFRQKNLETLRRYKAHKIVTHCPHCLNTFKNEYSPDSEIRLEVIHHSQLLEKLIAEGRIRLTRAAADQWVTFHDPCYLGRHNGEFASPRAVLDRLPGVKRLEMKRSRDRSFCCGGGGGQMWLESRAQQRVENLRLTEARQTGASLVTTACPFCKVMLETASVTTAQQEQMKVKDISELVSESMER